MTDQRDDDDLLERATRALRETSTPSDKELADGRAVLLWAQRSAKKKAPRGRTLRWVLPLAAVLTAGTALAATSGQLEWVAQAVDRCVESVREMPRVKSRRVAPPSDAVAARPIAPSSAAAPVVPAVAVAEAGVAPPPEPAEPVAAVAKPKPVGVWKPKPAPSTPAVATPTVEPLPPPAIEAPEPQPSPDLADYREAHRLHFKMRDFRSALAAWDRYLERHPHGTFALEALYNRAICLLRLGRNDEARRVLAPFARGAMQNGYRQTEATELLEALE